MPGTAMPGRFGGVVRQGGQPGAHGCNIREAGNTEVRGGGTGSRPVPAGIETFIPEDFTKEPTENTEEETQGSVSV